MSSEVIAGPFKQMLSEFDWAIDTAGKVASVRGLYFSGHHGRTLTDKAVELIEWAAKEARALLVELPSSDVSAAVVMEVAGTAVGALRAKLTARLAVIRVSGQGAEELLARFDAASQAAMAVVEAVLRPESLARLATDAQRPPMAFTNSTVVMGSVHGTGVAVGAGATATVTGLTPETIAAIRVTLSEVRGHIARAEISDQERAELVAAVDEALTMVREPGTTLEVLRRRLQPVVSRLETIGLGVLSSGLATMLGL